MLFYVRIPAKCRTYQITIRLAGSESGWMVGLDLVMAWP